MARELAAVPIYIVRVSEIPWLDGSKFLGATHEEMDIWLKQDLGDRWRGRGVGIVIKDAVLAELPEDIAPNQCLCWLVHESSHGLSEGWAATQPSLPDYQPEPEVRTRQLAAVRKAATEISEDPTPKQLKTHGEAFYRTACHLQQRAAALGTYLPIVQVAGYPYVPVRPEALLAQLGDEPQRLAHLTIREILEKPAPAKFIDLAEGRTGFLSHLQTLKGE